MTTLLTLALMSASWETPPPMVAQVLEAAPAPCVYPHGVISGLRAARGGFASAIRFS